MRPAARSREKYYRILKSISVAVIATLCAAITPSHAVDARQWGGGGALPRFEVVPVDKAQAGAGVDRPF